MQIEGDVDRQTLLTHYLQVDALKGRLFPHPFPNLPWEDPNAIDAWLCEHGYKFGVVTGFRTWAHVVMGLDELLDCAIVSHIFPGASQRFRELRDAGQVASWQPNSPDRYWYMPILNGSPIIREWALILRLALPSEKANFYIEDGSGRAFRLVASQRTVEAGIHAFIGSNPDPHSFWLQTHFEGHFLSQ